MEHAPAHALDYLSMIRRRRWWFLIPLVVALVTGVLLVRFLPKQYQSSATLGVAAPTVSPNLLNPSALLDNEERLRALSQQLLSPEVLARVVEQEGIREGEPTPAEIDSLRNAIELRVPEPVAGTSEPRRLDAFILSYADSDPSRAQRVVDRIVNVFVDENSKTRTAHAESTSAFLAAELEASQKHLAELEERLRQSKESFIGRLPEQTQANLETLGGLRHQLETDATALRGQQDRLTLIERQISAMEEGTTDALTTPIAAADGAAATPEARVLALEEELAATRRVYTEKHPEVIRLQEALEIARRNTETGRTQPAADRRARLLSNPTYRQLLADRDLTTLNIRELERADAGARRQIGEYQARVEAAPMVEQRLAAVQREYDLAQVQYQDLAAKHGAALMAENVARNRDGEQFTVLYGATLPTDPVSPIPWRVMLIALMGGLCVGGASALGREYLDRSVHNVHDVTDEFDLPVLGEVAHIPAA